MPKQQYIEFEFTSYEGIQKMAGEKPFYDKYIYDREKSKAKYEEPDCIAIKAFDLDNIPNDLLEAATIKTKIKTDQILLIQKTSRTKNYFIIKTALHFDFIKEQKEHSILLIPIKYFDQINNLLI